MNPDKNHRIIPRIDIECPMTYHDVDSPNIRAGTARNVSNNGILFIAREKMADGAIKEVHIRPESNDVPSLDAVIQVVRVEDDSIPGQYLIAGVIKAIK